MGRMKIGAFTAAILLAAAGIAKADPTPYGDPGNYNAAASSFVATSNGDLIAYFVGGSGAGYSNELGLLVNGVQQGNYGLANHSSSYGDMLNFGPVQAGQTLTFILNNLSLNKQAFSDQSLNAPYDDPSYVGGHNHIYTNSYGGDAAVPAGTYVAFEDLPFPGSDFNYDDESFVFTNVSAVPVSGAPEPGAWALMLGGLGLAGGLLRSSRALRRERSGTAAA